MEYKKKSTVTTTSYSIKRVIKALFKKHNNNKKNSNRNPTTRSLESLESLDNYRNTQYEEYYEEIGDNAANEKLLSCIYNDMNNYQYHTNDSFDNYNYNHDTTTTTSNTISNITSSSSASTPLLADTSIEEVQPIDIDEEDIFVPVRFARTEVGTYFWTTNLQPAAIITTVTTPLGDNLDLIQPTICYTTDQQHHYPQLQYQDRWAQA